MFQYLFHKMPKSRFIQFIISLRAFLCPPPTLRHHFYLICGRSNNESRRISSPVVASPPLNLLSLHQSQNGKSNQRGGTRAKEVSLSTEQSCVNQICRSAACECVPQFRVRKLSTSLNRFVICYHAIVSVGLLKLLKN